MVSHEHKHKLEQNALYSTYQAWPRLFRNATRSIDIPSYIAEEQYESVVFCGMGGSATSCDIMQQIMNVYGLIPALTLRGESMPYIVGRRSLVIVNSVSGNTIESLAMMKEALDRRARVICISAGGKLKKLAKRSGVYHIEIPDLSLPRASLPHLLVPGLLIIDRFLARSLREDMDKVPQVLSTTLKRVSIDRLAEDNLSKKVSNFLLDGFPFCYSSPSLFPATTRFRNSMNENAKVHCITGSILEASHNDIVPFTFDDAPETPKVLHLKWVEDTPLIKERFAKVQSLFEKVVQSAMEIAISEKPLLHALMSAIYILDLSSIYIAISKEIDPSPTPAISILKDF